MASEEVVHETSPAIQAHLAIAQSVIQRMAANSAACKTWCVSLVSGILVVIAEKAKPDLALIAMIPTVLFLVLDTYYLALERSFRSSYNSFVDKLHGKTIRAQDLYVVSPPKNLFAEYTSSVISFSIWPFYFVLALTILIAQHFVLQ